ncbi:hypothetical protein Tco_0257449 [Tanacetum coccineum]
MRRFEHEMEREVLTIGLLGCFGRLESKVMTGMLFCLLGEMDGVCVEFGCHFEVEIELECVVNGEDEVPPVEGCLKGLRNTLVMRVEVWVIGFWCLHLLMSNAELLW